MGTFLLADAASPAPSLTAAVLSSSLLAGVLTLLGKFLDQASSRSTARRQQTEESSGLRLRDLKLPTTRMSYSAVKVVLALVSVYFVGALALVIDLWIRGGRSDVLFPFVCALSLGLIITGFVFLRVTQAVRGVVGTYMSGTVRIVGRKTEVMERARYSLNRIGAVVIEYDLASGWIRAQRGRFGQEVAVTVDCVRSICAASVTSVSSFQLLPGGLDLGVNGRNVRGFVGFLVGGVAAGPGSK